MKIYGFNKQELKYRSWIDVTLGWNYTFILFWILNASNDQLHLEKLLQNLQKASVNCYTNAFFNLILWCNLTHKGESDTIPKC